MILDELLDKRPPELMVLCSSVSSIIGLPGQVDYTAANAFLDAYAIKRNLDGRTRAISINWSAWQEVGMAVDAARVVERKAELPVQPDAPISPVQLFDSVVDEGDDVVLTGSYSRDRRWLLDEHLVRGGDALIPGTGYLEIIRNAVSLAEHEAGPVKLRDVFFLSPFAVAADEVRTLRVKVEREARERCRLQRSRSIATLDRNRGGGRIEPCAASRSRRGSCSLRLAGRAVRRIQRSSVHGLRSTLGKSPPRRVRRRRSADHHRDARRVRRRVAGAVVAPGDARHGHRQRAGAHPGLLGRRDVLRALLSGRVLARRPLPQTAVSHVRLRETSVQDLAVFDISICDEDGNEVVDIEGFTMRRVPPGAALTERRDADARPEPPPLESPINAALREGILPAEGVDALDRILASGLSSQVVATSIDLHQWMARVDSEAAASNTAGDDGDSAAGPRFERPNISSAFVPPATPIERGSRRLARAPRSRTSRAQRRLLRAGWPVAHRRSALQPDAEAICARPAARHALRGAHDRTVRGHCRR